MSAVSALPPAVSLNQRRGYCDIWLHWKGQPSNARGDTRWSRTARTLQVAALVHLAVEELEAAGIDTTDWQVIHDYGMFGTAGEVRLTYPTEDYAAIIRAMLEKVVSTFMERR